MLLTHRLDIPANNKLCSVYKQALRTYNYLGFLFYY